MPEHDSGASPGSVKLPEHLGLATVLVWIATGDLKAFHIPAGRYGPESPALHIFDDNGASGFRAVAVDYIREYRRGTLTGQLPGEEVANAEAELLNHLRCDCLPAWLDGRKLRQLQWKKGQVAVGYEGSGYEGRDTCISQGPVSYFIRHEISFKREDILRNWPAKKPGPKVGQPSFKAAHCGKAEELLNAGTVQPGRGAIAEIIRIIQGVAPWTGCDESTIRKNITPAVNAWIERHKPAA